MKAIELTKDDGRRITFRCDSITQVEFDQEHGRTIIDGVIYRDRYDDVIEMLGWEVEK